MTNPKEEERLREDLEEELLLHKDEHVIVEGKNDRGALEELGFTDVNTINRGEGLYEVSEEVRRHNGDEKVLILTDFDPEGEKLAKKLRKYLRSVGCNIDTSGRRKLRKLFKGNKLTTVQGVDNILSGNGR